jgi:hypothetical protein
MRGGSTQPARIVAGELFRSVTVNLAMIYLFHDKIFSEKIILSDI